MLLLVFYNLQRVTGCDWVVVQLFFVAPHLLKCLCLRRTEKPIIVKGIVLSLLTSSLDDP